MLLDVFVNDILPLVLMEHAHKRWQNRLVAEAYQVWKSLAEGRCRLLEVIMRYQAEHVMHLVGSDRVDDIVNDAVVTVDGGELSADEVPSLVGVPWSVDVVVVEESHDDDV